MTNEKDFCFHSVVQLDNFFIIIGGLQRPSTHVIWTYNLHTEERRQEVIPKHGAPEPFYGAVAVAINGTIYTFGGTVDGKYADSDRDRNALWTLRKGHTGNFTWNFIKVQRKASPSPRREHTGWEYAGKLWAFGGSGSSPERYLNDHGDITRLHGYTVNNQLLCYNPNIRKWTNPPCFGDVPSPRTDHASAIINDKVWLFGGSNQHWTLHDDMFELTMHSLTWTRIRTVQPHPKERKWCTLTALPSNQLVLHGGDCGRGYYETLNDRIWPHIPGDSINQQKIILGIATQHLFVLITMLSLLVVARMVLSIGIKPITRCSMWCWKLRVCSNWSHRQYTSIRIG